ncbi:hypothetical protein, partial [Microbacterium oxydans]|uniref:hypothetical protein n=1 Tax=Microbacterium oxydans TaxID=82380 RepID=UPI0024AC9A44
MSTTAELSVDTATGAPADCAASATNAETSSGDAAPGDNGSSAAAGTANDAIPHTDSVSIAAAVRHLFVRIIV